MLIHVDQATLFPFWLCLCPWLREAGEEARVSTEKKILEELEKQPIMTHGEHERGSFLIGNMHKHQSNCKAKDGDYYDLYDDESEEHDTDGGDGDDNDDIQAGGLKKDNHGRARMTRLQKQVETQEYQHVIHDMIHNILRHVRYAVCRRTSLSLGSPFPFEKFQIIQLFLFRWSEACAEGIITTTCISCPNVPLSAKWHR